MTFEEWRDANEFGDCSPRAAWDAAVVNSKLTPEGYVLVPIEPTREMVVAGADCIDGITFLKDVYEAYKAMIQAAQEEE